MILIWPVWSLKSFLQQPFDDLKMHLCHQFKILHPHIFYYFIMHLFGPLTILFPIGNYKTMAGSRVQTNRQL